MLTKRQNNKINIFFFDRSMFLKKINISFFSIQPVNFKSLKNHFIGLNNSLTYIYIILIEFIVFLFFIFL